MTGALVLAESRRGELGYLTAQLVSAGRSVCGEDVTLLVVAEDARDIAARANLGPLAGILTVPVTAAAYGPNAAQAALRAAIREVSPEVVLLAHTNDRLGVGPAIAAAGGYGFASDVICLCRDEDGLIAHRGAFGGKVEAEVTFDGHDTTVLLLRSGAFPPATGRTEAAAEVLIVEVGGRSPIEHLGYEEQPANGVDIESAEVLVAVGRGLEDPAKLTDLEDLAVRLGGALVASRPLIDSGWVPASREVGQSGIQVAPKVYLALGVSGAAEHVAGIQAAETVIAVNKDASAPIFQIADYAVVGDLLEVSEALRKRLE